MSELRSFGPEARAVIEAERSAPGAAPGTRARLREQLWMALAIAPIVPIAASPPVPAPPLGAGGAALPSAAAGAGHSALSVSGRVLSVLARHPGPLMATTLTVGGFGGAALHSQIEQRAALREAKAPTHESRVVPAYPTPLLDLSDRAAETRPAVAPEVAHPVPSPVHPAPVHAKPLPSNDLRAAPAAPAAAVGPDVQLATETALLERARSAMARGWDDSALEALEQHRSRFPDGELVEEREALSVIALARAGRSEDAHIQATAFVKRFPGSLWLDQVEATEHRQP